MAELSDFMSLKAKKILVVETAKGYLQVLEYFLQDCKYLHVVQWHFNTLNETLSYDSCNVTFYNDSYGALKMAHEIGNELLQQY